VRRNSHSIVTNFEEDTDDFNKSKIIGLNQSISGTDSGYSEQDYTPHAVKYQEFRGEAAAFVLVVFSH